MNILPIVSEQISLNLSKLKEFDIKESLLTSVQVSNSPLPKIKVYNTNICVFVTENFNYILNVPNEYSGNFHSISLKMNRYDNIYLTFFNCIVAPSQCAFINSKIKVKKILNDYFLYMNFIEYSELLYEGYLQNKNDYIAKSEQFLVFALSTHFINLSDNQARLICISVE